MSNKINVGKSLRIVMAARDIPVHELAAKLNLTSNAISYYRNQEELSNRIITKLCDFFGIEKDDFIALANAVPDEKPSA